MRLSGYSIDASEVTNARFAKFVQTTGYQTDAERTKRGFKYTGGSYIPVQGSSWKNPGGPGTSSADALDRPVVQVSGNDAARPRGTPLQRAVWAALEAIPFGQTRTYGELARAIGRPTASRAVGAANARNPLSIVVPCHRVIAGTGRLQGYAGGLAAKRWLLDHELGQHIATCGM